MRTSVTAILIAQNGGDWLDQTLAGLRAQARTPDHIVALVTGGSQRVAEQLAHAGVTHIVTAEKTLPFGAAVANAVATLAPIPAPTQGAEHHEWLWLLSEDAAPEPRALELIVSTVHRSPSVAIAGPKLVGWDHPDRIIELGQSLTQRGDRWLLRRQELDQQQYDHLDDVLGVGPVGMLVRRDVWEQLDGFDPALPVYDDGLDLSVRARLAGYRVVVAPESRVRFGQIGVGGPRVDRSRRVIRKMHAQGRVSQLHRKIAYAPAGIAALMWILLPLVALGRVAWALIREHPGFMAGEFWATFKVFLRPGAILTSRRRIRAHQKVGWATLRTLQVDAKSVRTARMIDREAILAAQGRLRRELHFVSTGGLAVVLTAAVLGVILTWWVFGSTQLMGAALAPLNDVGTLWQNTRTINGVPADPFAWVLAILGSLTFWNPSLIIVILMVCALPLAAFGGWVWGAQLTGLPAGRALIGLGWATSPVLLGTLDSGRLPTLILAVALPWLLLAATRCQISWSWAGTASLLAAVVLACAPSLIPAAIVFIIIGVCTTVRGMARVLSIAIAPLILFAPKLIALIGGAPLTLFLDPGITPAYNAAAPWQMLLGFADDGIHAWGEIFIGLGWDFWPVSLITAIAIVPLAVLAVLGAVTGNVRTTLLHASLGAVGLGTAIVSSQISYVSVGETPVLIWAGSGVLLFWLALLGLAATGMNLVTRGAVAIVAVTLLGLLVLSGPLAIRLVTAQGSVDSAAQQMPAIVQASGAIDPHHTTLVVQALGDSQLRVTSISGSGLRLDDIRTVTQAAAQSPADQQQAQLVAELTTTTGESSILIAQLETAGVKYLLLSDEGARNERAYLQAAFDQQPALINAGLTEQGILWRVNDTTEDSTNAPPQSLNTPIEGTHLSGQIVWTAQIVLLLAMLLLALPTGEVTERAAKRTRTQRPHPRPAPPEPKVPDTSEATTTGNSSERETQ